MINQIIQIIDRLIQLLNVRADNRRQAFDLFIEPIFNDLVLIHSDYYDMFQSLLSDISKHPNSLARTIIPDVRKRRSELLPLRDKLLSLIQVLKDNENANKLY